ncbi:MULTISPECIES: alpha/beta fold hydrolase [Methylorubrum]|uniref:alpha/beta fold hydrolase n=1 Tax=Methylorubrum TaxID=2282523 RepID=UPI0020A232FC|nr:MULTISPECIES: alpha/beta fold hydrolase [Methylorubrum]MCP1550300.1 polyhydroxyalkanoate synthase [Methylorubrum zatmanii]MCP1553087.1 polyhydroxyalkanoate synthase [Methylorubrum extorquens]MCP1580603.1 polyhydroxyalkanoate synthase [Methylorubrum extorquens]
MAQGASIPGLKELAEFSQRAATAAAQLGAIRDEDVDVAATPREKIAQINGRTLYRIAAGTPSRVETPILVLYAMVGSWQILDLQPDRSFLRSLAEAGSTVYVVDWGHPTPADQFDDFSDLVDIYIDGFVEAIRDRHGIEQVNLLGICQGGVLSLCYSALHGEKIRNLITCVTPVDFHADRCNEQVERGFMNVWTRNLEARDIDRMIDTIGNVPGGVGGVLFSMMTPFRSLAKYNLTLMEAGQDRDKLLNFLRMEKWLADRPDHTGASARQWLKDLYQDNRLYSGTFEIGGRTVDLGAITMPVLNFYTETDHIIPAPASKAMAQVIGAKDYTEAPITGGHIGVFVSRGQAKFSDRILGWLETR